MGWRKELHGIGKKERSTLCERMQGTHWLCIGDISLSSGSLEQEASDARGPEVVHKWCLIDAHPTPRSCQHSFIGTVSQHDVQ